MNGLRSLSPDVFTLHNLSFLSLLCAFSAKMATYWLVIDVYSWSVVKSTNELFCRAPMVSTLSRFHCGFLKDTLSSTKDTSTHYSMIETWFNLHLK